jgi:hypothetical protein
MGPIGIGGEREEWVEAGVMKAGLGKRGDSREKDEGLV